MKDLPSGIVTFLFTDIVRSSELWQVYPEAMEVALARHDDLTRSAVQEHHGHLVKMRGDGLHAVFVNAVDALRAARAGQQALAGEDWPPPIDRLWVRMGLHTGHAQLRGGDYFGPVVNQAVRIQETAHGGQILLSQATATAVRDKLPAQLSLIDLEQQHVRDFPQPERVYQLSWPGLDETFPPLKTLPPKRSNLPQQAATLVGRKDELADVAKLLADPAIRLVTIIGPGGMGKTRFSIAAAEQQLAAAYFSDGVIFIALAPLSDVDQIPAAMADAFSLPLEVGTQQRTSGQQVLDFLHNKEMLLVMDNFEHLLAGANWVHEILQTAPQVKILATSRERLQLRSEHLYPISGLQFSEEDLVGKETAGYTAVELLLQRIRQVQPGFNPTEEDMLLLSRICRLVEGMPLALELAAGWVDVLTLEDIASEIQQSLDILQTDVRDVPQRQRSIRAVFDNSWERLNAGEQEVLAEFSLFRGGFTMEAARQITGVSLRTLHKLANKSLLQHDAAQKRYQIHELLRQYGAEKLGQKWSETPDAAAAASAIRDRHSVYYCSFLKELVTKPEGKGRDVALAKITADVSNIYGAWHWAVEQADLEIISGCAQGLASFFLRRGPLQEGDRLLDLAAGRLQEILDSEPQADQETAVVLSRVQANRASVLNRRGQYEEAIAQAQSAVDLAQTHGAVADEAMGYLQWGRALWFQGDYDAAQPILEQAIDLARASAHTVVEAESIRRLGAIYWPRGEYERAKEQFEQALMLYKTAGDRQGEALALNNLGLIALEQGQFMTAKKTLEQALAINRQINDRGGEGRALTNLGNACWQLGLFDEALAHNEAGMVIHQELGIKRGEAYSLNNLGVMLTGVGDYEQAKSHYEAAHQLYRQYGELRGQSTVLVNLGLLAGDNGDWPAALRFANQALALAEEVGVRRNMAEASGLIGRIRAATGDLVGAEKMYQEALSIRQELGQTAAAMEPLAGLADIAREQGDLPRAKVYVEQILDRLASGALQGASNQLRVYSTCYRVLVSLQDQRDVEILQTAYHLLQERLSHIGDPYWKRTFVENVQAHREILDTYKQRSTAA